MRHSLMLAAANICFAANHHGHSAPPAPEAPKPASAETVAETLGTNTADAPKQSEDGPPVVAAETAERDGKPVEPTQVEGFAPAVAKVDGEDGSNGEVDADPALGVEPGQAIDQSGGNPVAEHVMTTGQMQGIDTSPRVQANGRLAEAGPDHGDLPPDPTMASEALHERVQQIRAGEEHLGVPEPEADEPSEEPVAEADADADEQHG